MKNITIDYNETIRDYLASIAERFGSGNECERFVFEHGGAFRPASLPPGIHLGPPRECYRNAANLAFTRSDLFYVEGYARCGLSIPFEHAWGCDAHGSVIDPTWKKPGTEYFGVVFRTSFVRAFTVQTGVWGLIDRNHLNQLLAFPASRWQPALPPLFHNQ